MKPPDKVLHQFSEGRFALLTFLILVVSGLALFSNSFSNGFHLDDFHTIIFNTHVHSLEGIPSFFLSGRGFSGTPFVSGFRPVTATLNALNYAFSKTDPVGYHLVNLSIHILVSFLVFLIALRLCSDRTLSLLAGFLFLVHPANTEVVNYISGRSSSLSALFYLSSFWTFLIYRKEKRTRWIFFSFMIFILALLTKEVSVTFPLLLIAYDYFYSPEPFSRNKLREWLVYLIPLLCFLISRHYFMSILKTTTLVLRGDTHFIEMAQRVFYGSLFLATHYFLLYLFPFHLSFDHPFPKPGFTLATFFPIFLWTLILVLAIFYRKPKLPLFLAGWYLITLLPVFLLPGISTLALFQENRGYLSGAGLIILFALGIRKIGQILDIQFGTNGRKGAFVLIVSLFTLYSYVSYQRNPVWRTEVTIWTDTLEKNPTSFIASFSLGYGYLTENKWDYAQEYFTRSLELSPPREYLYYIHNNLGAVYQYKNALDSALSEYRTAAALSPGLPEAHLNLGELYLKEGRYEDTEKEMATAIDMECRHMELRVRAAVEMENHGAIKEAQRLFLKISEKLPFSPECRDLLKIIEEHLHQDLPQSGAKRANPFPSFNTALKASGVRGL
jgi:tetratricopeptide (TPR) repeat protein